MGDQGDGPPPPVRLTFTYLKVQETQFRRTLRGFVTTSFHSMDWKSCTGIFRTILKYVDSANFMKKLE